jgi:hypothetical protein
MGEVKKKKIRVIGINRTKSLAAYGQKIEKAMNELIEDGYRVEPHEEPTGVLLVSRLRSDEPEHEHPLARLFGQGAVLMPMIGERQETSSFSPKTIEIIGRFAKVVSDEESFSKDMSKHGRECTKDYSVPELEEVKAEVAKALEEHNRTCDPKDRRAQFWTALIGVLAQVQQQNLQ